jgi:acyl-CoA synthetase (AMP-forming)/AMP-acid ligase II
VSPDTQGEICVRGTTLFSRYLNNEETTKSSMLDDPTRAWFRTGDKGYLSTKHQQYAIIGRYKEIFKVRYEEVSPSEVEAELLKHPSIIDAAVISTARDNEKDCEWVAHVVAEDLTVSAYDVLRFAASRLSRHKIPTGGVLFCDEIRRTTLGKVLRR